MKIQSNKLTDPEQTRTLLGISDTLSNSIIFLARLMEMQEAGQTVDEDGDDIDMLIRGACGVIVTSHLQIGTALNETGIMDVGANWMMASEIAPEEIGIRPARGGKYN